MIYISYFQTKIASTLFYLNKFLPLEAKSYLIYKSLDSFNIYLKAVFQHLYFKQN